MEMWDQEFVDMETEGYFFFKKDQLGSFQFSLVQGQIDYRIEKIGEIERIEFSWEGQDEDDVALGRGWAVIKNEQIEGRSYFHLGDELRNINKNCSLGYPTGIQRVQVL